MKTETPAQAIEDGYKWLRACGYTHEQALKALASRIKPPKPAESETEEEQKELFTR